MAIQIKHPFISAKGDGTDATLVRPSNWNAVHTTSMATAQLLGRFTAGVGSFEEIPTTAFMAGLLNSADAASFLTALGAGVFETGDVKFSISPTAASGWIAYNGEGTISKAGAGGSVLASATAQPLWEIIYNNIIDTYCNVSGGRTGNAVNDFNAGKTMSLPRFSGRGIIGAGTGATLSARVAGQYGGEENHLLTTAEMPAHTHANSLSDPSHVHTAVQPTQARNDGTSVNSLFAFCTTQNTSAAVTGITITNQSQGGGATHNNMQPFVALWVKVKL